MLLLAVDRLYSTSTGLGEYSIPPDEQCRYLFEALTSLATTLLPPVSDVQRQVHRLMLAHGSARPELKEVGRIPWLDSQIPLRVPLLLQPQELADTSLTELFKRFKSGLLCALHALLNQQRVLFLGHGQPAEIVCNAVLSLPLMVRAPSSSCARRDALPSPVPTVPTRPPTRRRRIARRLLAHRSRPRCGNNWQQQRRPLILIPPPRRSARR